MIHWQSENEWVFTLNNNVLLLVQSTTGDSHAYIDPHVTCSQAVWAP